MERYVLAPAFKDRLLIRSGRQGLKPFTIARSIPFSYFFKRIFCSDDFFLHSDVKPFRGFVP
jgi:hypothetical protein